MRLAAQTDGSAVAVHCSTVAKQEPWIGASDGPERRNALYDCAAEKLYIFV